MVGAGAAVYKNVFAVRAYLQRVPSMIVYGLIGTIFHCIKNHGGLPGRVKIDPYQAALGAFPHKGVYIATEKKLVAGKHRTL